MGFPKQAARGKFIVTRYQKPRGFVRGRVPAIDHSISSDISFDNYRYFIDALRKQRKI